MKNREKYAEEIKNYNGTNFCKDFIKPIIHKKENYCSIGCERCAMLTALWLEEEYTEPIIDWSKVYTWYGEEKLDYARILTNAEAEKWDKWKDLEKQGRLIEVIRCKDCIRHSDEYIAGADGISWCDEHDHLTDDNDYCSCAVAKLAEMEGAK